MAPSPRSMLNADQARAFYDRFGAKQDNQFYEDDAIDTLLAQGRFDDARAVFEFGCGTGRLGERLLTDYLSRDSAYTGVDISGTMISLANSKMAVFNQANVYQTDGEPLIPLAESGSYDRFVSTYVLDLLSDDDIRTVLGEAYRLLSKDGYLCLAGLTHGSGLFSRLVELVWRGLFILNPKITGGCRPISLTDYLDTGDWLIVHHGIRVSIGISSEIVIARRR